MIPTMKGTDDSIGDSSTTENVEKASDDEVSGSNEEMCCSALPASAGMMSSEALPVEGTLENKEDEGTSHGTGKGSTHTLQLQELISSPIHDQNNQHYLKMIHELLTESLKSSLQHRDSVTQIQKQQDLQQDCLTEIQKQHDLIQKQQELNQACERQILKHQESQLKLLNEENKLHDYIQRQQELQQELIGCRLPHRFGKLGPLDSGTQVWDHWDRMEDDLMKILTEIRKIWKSFLAQQVTILHLPF